MDTVPSQFPEGGLLIGTPEPSPLTNSGWQHRTRDDLNLCLGLRRCPPCLHHLRQFLPHSCTHRLPSSRFLGDRLDLFRPGFAFLLCPPSLLRSPDSGPCCLAHATTFLAARWFSLAPLGCATGSCGSGTEPYKSCNCLFDTASFLSELCHYTLNVHVVLSLIRAAATPPQFRAMLTLRLQFPIASSGE